MPVAYPLKISISDLQRDGFKPVEGLAEAFFASDFAVAHLTDANAFFQDNVELGQPYQWTDHRLGVVLQGDADLTDNLRDYHLHRGSVVIIGKDCIVQINRISPDYRAAFLLFNDVYSPYIFGDKASVDYEIFNSTYVASVDDSQLEVLGGMIDEFLRVAKAGFYNHHLVGSFIATLVNYVLLIRNKQVAADAAGASRATQLFNHFMHLVNRHAVTHRQLQFYADELCISKKYLCLVVKSVSGMTAKEWIDLGALNHAKVMLRRTSMPIAEISNAMGFSQDSAFSKFFKRITGLSPQQYRQRR